jgi:hypothetical protein
MFNKKCVICSFVLPDFPALRKEIRRRFEFVQISSMLPGLNEDSAQPLFMAESSSAGSDSGSQQSNGTGHLPGDDTWTRWRNIFSIMTGRMSDEGKEQYRVARDSRNEASDCQRCEDQRDYLLKYSKALLPQSCYIYYPRAPQIHIS